MSPICTIRASSVAVLAALTLLGCARQAREAPPAAVAVPEAQALREGRPFEVRASDSLLAILVYRGGTLGRMGHNHVVASHDLTGTVYVPEDLTRASFELHVPVEKLAVDEAELRAEAGPDFPGAVPDSAKEATWRNMLSEALLDAAHYPEIVLRSERVDVAAPNDLLAQVQITIKNQAHSVTVPVLYELAAGALTASGEFSLKHSELGLTPFSAMMGAIQVQDEMKIRFRIHCTPGSPSNSRGFFTSTPDNVARSDRPGDASVLHSH